MQYLNIDFSLERILGRATVEPIPGLMNDEIRNRSILVTGAGGSIGAEICRQLVPFAPARLVLIEHCEHALFEICGQLQATGAVGNSIKPFLCSVGEEQRLRAIIRDQAVDTVYHAAAYKHVAMAENNVSAVIKNNVFGTLAVCNAVLRERVAKLVVVSTDKAVSPRGIMGASKWITERIVESLQESSNNGKNPGCRLMYARFGNVLSSSGSVFTIFVRQLLSGEPLTITDPHATRYFMSLREAGSLVIQAGAMGKGGDALVLRMGRPISILDLAHRIVREINDNHLPRPRNGKEVAMRIVGLRDGEKKHEQLFSSGPPQSTGHPMIVRELAKPIPWPTLSAELETLRELAERASDSAAKELVYDLIGTRTPIAIP